MFLKAINNSDNNIENKIRAFKLQSMIKTICYTQTFIIHTDFYNKKDDESRDDHFVVPTSENRI